jgi:transcriptional regulator with XRE-family HTH domain
MRSMGMEDLARATRPATMSQSELATLLGVTQQVVSKWARGVSTPDDRMQQRLFEILGIPKPHWSRPPRVEPTEKTKGKRTPKPRRAA